MKPLEDVSDIYNYSRARTWRLQRLLFQYFSLKNKQNRYDFTVFFFSPNLGRFLPTDFGNQKFLPAVGRNFFSPQHGVYYIFISSYIWKIHISPQKLWSRYLGDTECALTFWGEKVFPKYCREIFLIFKFWGLIKISREDILILKFWGRYL